MEAGDILTLVYRRVSGVFEIELFDGKRGIMPYSLAIGYTNNSIHNEVRQAGTSSKTGAGISQNDPRKLFTLKKGTHRLIIFNIILMHGSGK